MFVVILGTPKDKQLKQAYTIVNERLPEDNYNILKYIIVFLSKVSEKLCLSVVNILNDLFYKGYGKRRFKQNDCVESGGCLRPEFNLAGE